MGAGGVPNRTIERIDGRYGGLPTRSAKPNARYDLYVNGNKVQSRWFDLDARVTRNRDFKHQDAHHNHKFPHDHNWVWVNGKPIRDKNPVEPDYEKYY